MAITNGGGRRERGGGKSEGKEEAQGAYGHVLDELFGHPIRILKSFQTMNTLASECDS
jgi:hypothetical protein